MSFGRHLLFPILSLTLFFSGVAYADTKQADPYYAINKTTHLPGLTRWDYLTFDSKEHLLFITRNERVDVLSVLTNLIIGSIPADGAHGVALAPEFDKGFISNGKSNTITVFNLKTMQPMATVPTGAKPDSIVYDAKTQRLFVANADSSDMTVISAKDNKVVGTIKLDGEPEFTVVDGKGKLYLNIVDKSQIDIVDAKNLKIVGHYNLSPACNGPTGLAIDTIMKRLFSTCANKTMMIVDAESGKVIDTLPIGEHSDAAAFDAETGLAFSSNGDGTLTVVGLGNDGHYKVIQTVETKLTARTMAINPETHEIYLAAAETEGTDPPTAQHPQPRPHLKPDTFMIITVGAVQ